MIARIVVRGLSLAVLALTCGCAWTNRANRPVWNTFEQHLVPEGDAAFYASLPLTVPAGFAAIATDTFVVHPVQVIDDAWCDTKNLWNDLEWPTRYYTELAILPFRAGATPVVLLGSFLARSAFDFASCGSTRDDSPRIEPTSSRDAELERHRTQIQQRRARALLERVAARDADRDLRGALRRMHWPDWNPELDEAWQRAVTSGTAEMRMQLFEIGRTQELPPWRNDPLRGLRDPSAVVRYQELRDLAASQNVPESMIDALRRDPDEAVRELALTRWP